MKKFLSFLINFSAIVTSIDGGIDVDGLCETTITGVTDDGQRYEYKVPVCCSGYTQDNSRKCTPICEKPCIYGSCKAPNVCECNDGYQMIKNECVPICKNKCVNGYCSGPGICGCPRGFELDPKNATFCIPTCQPKCAQFSVCVKSKYPNPNRCECIRGYVKNQITNNCEPVCKEKCTNGFCNAPETCKCFRGFELDKNNSTNCLPICEPKCQPFSTCAKPNVCECAEGYNHNKVSGKCEPVCKDQIKYSRCIEPPNTWVCIDGYQYDPKLGICVMKSCTCNSNSYCLHREDECLCYGGFTKNYETGQCELNCKPDCQNSVCVENNVCQCLDGYHRTAVEHICEENNLCFGKPCHNGECLITGECRCKPGFIKSLSFGGQLQCDKVQTFIGKAMTAILGVPLLLALAVLIFVNIMVKKKSYKVEEQEMRLIHRG